MAKGQHKYHDDWILEHYDPNMRWSALVRLYNETFGTSVRYPTFVSHVNRELKLQQDFNYTEEQDNFLKETYPLHGYQETTKMFNDIFGTNRTPDAIQHRCKDVLGVYIGTERKKQLHKTIGETNYKVQSVGTISSGLYGTPAIKTESGWQRLDRVVAGTPGPGQILVHLDGNRSNNDSANLMIIDRNITTRMAKNHFWSDNPEVTRTGILWCQLDKALADDGFRKPREK